MISIICAIGNNRGIGKNNKLLWHIPEDLRHFKKITTGSVVVMGGKTFESIGKPLPNRTNIVVTRDKELKAEGCLLKYSLEDVIEEAKTYKDKEIFIIGGGEIYKQSIAHADKLYLTIVDEEAEADTFFPDYSEFKNIVSESEHELNGLKFKFVELTK